MAISLGFKMVLEFPPKESLLLDHVEKGGLTHACLPELDSVYAEYYIS